MGNIGKRFVSSFFYFYFFFCPVHFPPGTLCVRALTSVTYAHLATADRKCSADVIERRRKIPTNQRWRYVNFPPPLCRQWTIKELGRRSKIVVTHHSFRGTHVAAAVAFSMMERSIFCCCCCCLLPFLESS